MVIMMCFVLCMKSVQLEQLATHFHFDFFFDGFRPISHTWSTDGVFDHRG